MIRANLPLPRQVKSAVQVRAPIKRLATIKLIRIERSHRQVKFAEIVRNVNSTAQNGRRQPGEQCDRAYDARKENAVNRVQFRSLRRIRRRILARIQYRRRGLSRLWIGVHDSIANRAWILKR